jgi:hypothetical protein
MTPTDPRAEPSEKPTKELPAVPAWAVELTQSVKSGIAELRADVALVSNDLGVVKDRVAILESFRSDQEQRANRTSAGVRSLSTTDAAQEAQLAQERAAREELAAKVDSLAKTNETQLAILGRLDAVVKNPLAKTLVAMLATAAITWLAGHGVHVP